mgnify:CR=1 FL=1
MVSGRIALGLTAALVLMASLLVASPERADAVGSLRDYKCMVRADRYADDPHPNVPPQELADRIDWLYSQCQENRDAEAIAEEQGSKAEELFPNTENDRHAHPLHCMSFTDSRFGMHTEHDSANPPDDPNGPGGSAAVNITGEFMYAWIDGKARFLSRYVVWTVDDRDGNVMSPVKINQHPTYMGTPQTTVARVSFDEAYAPVSIWVELPDTMATANNENSGVLPGRRLTVRAWMESHCHDKRDPVVIPHMLINRMQDLGWLDEAATPREPRVVRFRSNGDPDLPSSWSMREVPVSVPSAMFNRGQYRWFYDSEVLYNQADEQPPSKPTGLTATPIAPRKVHLEWNASTDNVGVAGYFVYRNGKKVGFTQDREFIVPKLWPETRYRFKVKAVDEAGNRSVRSKIVRARTLPDTTKPSKPKQLTVDPSRKSLLIEWNPATDNVEVSHYNIKLDGQFVATTSDLDYRILGLSPDTDYHVAVRAVDVFGNKGKLVHRFPTTDP